MQGTNFGPSGLEKLAYLCLRQVRNRKNTVQHDGPTTTKAAWTGPGPTNKRELGSLMADRGRHELLTVPANKNCQKVRLFVSHVSFEIVNESHSATDLRNMRKAQAVKRLLTSWCMWAGQTSRLEMSAFASRQHRLSVNAR